MGRKLKLIFLVMLCNIMLFASSYDTVKVSFPRPLASSVANRMLESGYSYDYLLVLSQCCNFNLEAVLPSTTEETFTSWSIIEELNSGRVDLFAGIVYSDKLAQEVLFSKNYYGFFSSTLITSQYNYDFDSYSFSNLDRPLRIGIIKNDYNTDALIEYLDYLDVDYSFFTYETKQEAIEAVKKEELDLIKSNSLVQTPGFKTVAKFGSFPLYFATRKDNQEFMDLVDEGILTIREYFPNLMTRLANKYSSSTILDFEMSDEELKELKANNFKIKALCVDNSGPFVFKGKKGNEAGISVEILNAFASKVGLEVEYTFFDPKGSFMEQLEEGNFNCILGIPVNSNYNSLYGIINSVPYVTNNILMVSKNKKNFGSLNGCSIALQKGSRLAFLLKDSTVKYYDSMKDCLLAVKHNEVDVAFGSEQVIDFYLNQLGLNIYSTNFYNIVNDIGFAFPNEDNKAFITLLNRYINSIDQLTLFDYENATALQSYQDPVAQILRNNPVMVLILLFVFIGLVCTVIFLVINAKRDKKYNQALKHVSEVKTDFLSRMSHDLRTPLNGIIGSSVIALESKEIEEKNESLSDIYYSGEYMLRLVNDILDMAQIDNGSLELTLSSFSLDKFITDITRMFTPLCEEKQIVFNIENHSTVKYVYADFARFEQIFFNLLSNSVKYTPQNGIICFTIEETIIDNSVRFKFIVKDNGIGISKNFQTQIFELFSREETGIAAKEKGVGIGLAIVKQLVDLMKGTISCKSEVGRGTEFVVEIPFLIDDSQEEIDEKSDIDENLLAGKRVLICEDNLMNYKIISRLLNKKGMLTEHAINGKDGVDMFFAESEDYYDLLIMDIRMPVLDGLSATRIIRSSAHKRAKSIPIIALTANAFEEDLRMSYEAGINYHLTKPVESHMLYKVITQVLTLFSTHE